MLDFRRFQRDQNGSMVQKAAGICGALAVVSILSAEILSNLTERGGFSRVAQIPIRRGNATVGHFKCPRSSAGIDDRGAFSPRRRRNRHRSHTENGAKGRQFNPVPKCSKNYNNL